MVRPPATDLLIYHHMAPVPCWGGGSGGRVGWGLFYRRVGLGWVGADRGEKEHGTLHRTGRPPHL